MGGCFLSEGEGTQKVRWEGLVGASIYWALYVVQILPLLPTSGATSSLLAEAESLGEKLGNLYLLCLLASVYSGVGAEAEGNLGCCSSGSITQKALCFEPVSHWDSRLT